MFYHHGHTTGQLSDDCHLHSGVPGITVEQAGHVTEPKTLERLAKVDYMFTLMATGL